MKRIITVLAVMALMAAMLAASAMPAFADKGGFGKSTFTGDCEGSSFDCSSTRAGKQGNINGGPGRTDANLSSDISGTEEDFINLSGTSSGGGGRCEFDNTITRDPENDIINEDPRGKNAPCPEGFFGGDR